MMRWAYLCGDPGIPALGDKGAAIHVRQVVAALRETGDEVRLLARGRPGAEPSAPAAAPGLWLSPENAPAPRTRAAGADASGLARTAGTGRGGSRLLATAIGRRAARD